MINWKNGLDDIPFIILQPWWQTSWIQALIISAVMLVFYLVFRSQMTVLRHRNEKLNALNEHKKNLIAAEIETLERERSRVAKDLHDGIGMNLTVLKLHLHQHLKRYEASDSFSLEEQLTSTIQEIRDITRNLTPPGISRFGLAEVLEEYIHRTTNQLDVKIELFSSGQKITNPKISLFSFRILQELLANSLKHSRASMITIRISGADDLVNIIYMDNGIGFDPNTSKNGSGLFNIQARLENMDGKIEFSSGNPGVLYIINIPLENFS